MPRRRHEAGSLGANLGHDRARAAGRYASDSVDTDLDRNHENARPIHAEGVALHQHEVIVIGVTGRIEIIGSPALAQIGTPPLEDFDVADDLR